MAWAVDTCVALDVALGDAVHGAKSAAFLERRLSQGLVLCPVVLVELAPQFGGDLDALKDFCRLSGFGFNEPWLSEDTETAARAFSRYVKLRRAKDFPKRPVADILIGAFAARFQGLITRNPEHFKPYFPELRLAVAE